MIVKMCIYEQILIYMFVELYKNIDTGLTKQNVLERREIATVPKRIKISIQDFYTFCIILDHVLPVCIAYVYDILYMCYINKEL